MLRTAAKMPACVAAWPIVSAVSLNTFDVLVAPMAPPRMALPNALRERRAMNLPDGSAENASRNGV